MTSNSRSKRDARERVQATGERYTVARRQTGRPPGRRFAADHCANCLNPLPDEVAALFCSELCGQTAEFVRYLRRVTRDGRINDPDVQYATQVRMAHLVAGGYAKTARHLSTAIRAQVRERDGGRCRYCGKPGDEIDHSAGDSSDLANLQLLCRACHHAKTDRQMIPADQNAKEVVSKIRRRVESDVPVLLCDDEQRWQSECGQLKKDLRPRRQARLGEAAPRRGPMRQPAMSRRDSSDEVFLEARAEWLSELADPETGYGADSYFARAMAKND